MISVGWNDIAFVLAAGIPGEGGTIDNLRLNHMPDPGPDPVSIDIKPGNDENCFERRNGFVPVSILGNPDFDVTNINVRTLRLDSDLGVRSDRVYCSLDYINDDETPFFGSFVRLLDLPLTTVFDTLILPVSVPVELSRG